MPQREVENRRAQPRPVAEYANTMRDLIDVEFAKSLAYFLWSFIPDEQRRRVFGDSRTTAITIRNLLSHSGGWDVTKSGTTARLLWFGSLRADDVVPIHSQLQIGLERRNVRRLP